METSNARPTVAAPRPLPVIVIADVSGSMTEYRKLETLNESIDTMIRTFAAEDTRRGEIQVAVVAFGGERAYLHQPLALATRLTWTNLAAGGRTPLGKAFTLVADLFEDEQMIPKRAFTPTLVLVSDGKPTDDWEGPLDRLLATDRGAKAIRLAVGVGQDMEEEDFQVLERFIANSAIKPTPVDEVHRLSRYFSWVTLSVTQQARSGRQSPVEIGLDQLDEFLG